jgi:hypothetical protein
MAREGLPDEASSHSAIHLDSFSRDLLTERYGSAAGLGAPDLGDHARGTVNGGEVQNPHLA